LQACCTSASCQWSAVRVRACTKGAGQHHELPAQYVHVRLIKTPVLACLCTVRGSPATAHAHWLRLVVANADQHQHQHGLQHQRHGNMFQSVWDRQGSLHAAQRMYCLLGGRDSVWSTCQLTGAVLQDDRALFCPHVTRSPSCAILHSMVS
jgi:hypothetical protein